MSAGGIAHPERPAPRRPRVLVRIASALAIALVSLLLVAAIELAAHVALSRQGLDVPFLLNAPAEEEVLRPQREDRLMSLDPHLGFAHGSGQDNVRDLRSRYMWAQGFAVYAREGEPLRRPVVLALGGSTTDGVRYGHSWPEELARILESESTPATVINGGTGGYSTNQELIKLIRDGLSFGPDVVISYSGVNDRGRYSEPHHPMVHPYQRELIDALLGRTTRAILLPSTVLLVQRSIGGRVAPDLDASYGLPSDLSPAEQYLRNLALMDSLSRARGAAFFAFLQPHAYHRSRHEQDLTRPRERDQLPGLLALYDEISEQIGRVPFLYDATAIFEEHDGVYKGDGIHATPKGDAIIARHVLETIREDAFEAR